MELSLRAQAASLLLALGLGALLGLLYDLLRPPRRSPVPAALALDALFCLLCGGFVFFYAMSAGSGRLGLWELAAMLLGDLLYLHTLSAPFLRLRRRLLHAILKIIVLPKKVLKKPLEFAKKCFQNLSE